MLSPKILYLFIILFVLRTKVNAKYLVGVGRADCTGPAAQITFMGYADLSQKGCGIHLRQYSRAFIFDDGKTRVAFVSVDACMINNPIKEAVIEKLANLYNDTYTMGNLVLSGTHTHSTPGGFLKDFFLDAPITGFVKETFDALLAGIVRSVIRAHSNMVEAKIFMNSGDLLDTNINRSPASYLLNPYIERIKYEHKTDKEVVQLKIVRTSDDSLIGAVNWYPVHAVSMNKTNCLISSDNVGYASMLLEKNRNADSLPGQGTFVGAFASTNLGDVSPNTKGPICTKTGKACDYVHSTCNGSPRDCIASGPGKDMEESTEIIATNLFNKALELLINNNNTELTGDVKFIHRFVYMPNQTATIQINSTYMTVKACYPAMGASFAAGTTDGPGPIFFQGNPLWNIAWNNSVPPTQSEKACHYPKPILFMTGKIPLPYEWQPAVVSIQMLQIGQFYIAAVPGEFTTMSGRRLRNKIESAINANSGSAVMKIVIAGLSNVYTDYVTTPEEYQLQRYEGASTIFGPHTLTIYLKLYSELVNAMIKGEKLDSSTPYKFPEKLLTLVSPVFHDSKGLFKKFGDCIIQPKKNYNVGETVSATFVAGNPRNNNLQERTFLTVEKLEQNKWIIVATDASWETKFIWKQTSELLHTSEATIQWNIKNSSTEPGVYRIQHYGNYKHHSRVNPYVGTSNNFVVA